MNRTAGRADWSEVATLPGAQDFVHLENGLCHYRLGGRPGGPPILLIHGATVPGWEFDRLVPFLHAAGFRTLRPDLFGHGYSDRPAVSYDHALFVAQMRELLDRLLPGQRVGIVGHSLGAAIGVRLALAEPARIGPLVLAAPLLDFTANSRASKLLSLPGLGESLMSWLVVPMLVRRRTARYRGIEDGRFVQMFRDQLRVPRFGNALLSLVRDGSLGDQSDCYRALGQTGRDALLVRGTQDEIVSRGQIEAIRSLAPQLDSRSVEGAAHAFILTHPARVARELLPYLAAAESPA